ncbi:hypothetical protein JSO63_02840 [Riemerella anatipestifer]|uniref:hypothetical protein n=1 Tax=Riemerella anatipestifer TaxID=34085 RepID=UPI0012DB27F9|nr:hypothetical protein [Riemerella anatipestifer]
MKKFLNYFKRKYHKKLFVTIYLKYLDKLTDPSNAFAQTTLDWERLKKVLDD